MNIVCMIQARLGSTRLPGKVLKPILDRPMLSYMLERVKAVKKIEQLVIATTENETDDPIVQFCRPEKIQCFRGSENDVLDRYYQAARSAQAEIIVRLTADCPLIDPAVVDEIVEAFLAKYPGIDFASNVKPATFPDGMDTEVFSFAALERAWKETKNPLEREHVTPYFYDVPGRFRTFNVEAEQDFSSYRLTVDYEDDFEVMAKIFESLYRPDQPFGFREAIKFLDENPEILKKNAHQRNPWYAQYQASRKDHS